MLPFDLPTVTRGFAELAPHARAVGVRAAARAAAGLAAGLGLDVRIEGRALPGSAPQGRGCVRLLFDLAALPATAALDLEASFAARLVDRLAGGPGSPPGASRLTPVELTAVELLALLALESFAREEDLEAALAPRLVRGGDPPERALVVGLRLVVGPETGRGWLHLPAAALRALRGKPEIPEAVGAVTVTCSLRSGFARAAPAELEELGRGDVLLLDEAPGSGGWLVPPGGPRLPGRVAEESFRLEEGDMDPISSGALVTLEVEIARVPLTLADLARLQPGATLPLPVGRSGFVQLRVGDRAVGRGELVDVEGAVGVRILELGA
jgi:type III secretion system YscQ/HrcQ family protein